ncbi:MAG: DUF389 domain-containing protein [Thermoleophilaceae bacterium]
MFTEADHTLSNVIASPDFFAFFVALCAGAAGVLSLTSAKSGALIGVLISVTTIPAAANIGVAFAYQDWPAWRGSMLQLAINLGSLLVAGVTVLGIQRYLYHRRRAAASARSVPQPRGAADRSEPARQADPQRRRARRPRAHRPGRGWVAGALSPATPARSGRVGRPGLRFGPLVEEGPGLLSRKDRRHHGC